MTETQKQSLPPASMLESFSHRTIVVASLISLLTFGISAGLTALRSPVPDIHDEFSYLLAADTFAQGRLTNPTHPHWQHFESFQIIHEPSYTSKYPPGQGLVLATGQWLTGRPIVGLWILSALAAAACYWMFLGWVSKPWAAVGGFLFAVHPCYQIIWGQSFWGGTLAFLGGALVFGAVARMLDSPRVVDSIAMSFGAIVLSVSRPYEGFIFCLIIGAVVLIHWWKNGFPKWRVLSLQIILPQVIVFIIGGACIAQHNRAVTGSWKKLPYQIHETTYALSPGFLWQKPYADREYRHASLSKFHNGWEMQSYRDQRTLGGLLGIKWLLFRHTCRRFFPWPLLLPLLLVPFCHDRHKRLIGTVGFLALLPSAVTVWSFPHYLAAAAPVMLLLALLGLRHVNYLGKKYLGVPQLAALLIACQVIFFVNNARNYIATPKVDWQWQKAAFLHELEETAGKHLVMVHYETDHNPHHEWVYNRADIDGAKVVWAREMTPEKDKALIDYFQDRKVWVLEADAEKPELVLMDADSTE